MSGEGDLSMMNDGDVAWVLASTALVMFMTPGLAFFYGGLVRGQNVLNTMMMSIICMGLVAVPWFIYGFSLAFAPGVEGGSGQVIGDGSYVGLWELTNTIFPGLTIPTLLVAVFQLTFAMITAAIISGAVVERMSFDAFCLFILPWSLLVYDPIAHCVWSPTGWIFALGAKDFAGGTVVHICSASSSLALAILLGPREVRTKDGKPPPHNVPFVILGASILWFGWSGFNGGSALAANQIAVLALVNTYLASTMSLITWAFIERIHRKRASAVGMMTGCVVGLVIITPACGFVQPLGAVIMGCVGTILVYPTFMLSHRRIDDSLDCFPCHGISGFVGTVLTGFFATDGGVFYGGGGLLLGRQIAACVAVAGYSFVVSGILFLLLKLVVRVRVSPEEETFGLDMGLHGEEAYQAAGASPKTAYTGEAKPTSTVV